MNVQAATKLFFGHTAVAASVAVALACLIALPMPVGAAVVPILFSPFACILLYAVFVVALLGAVEIDIASILRLVSLGGLAAIGAGELDQGVGPTKGAVAAGGIIALWRTEPLTVSTLAVLVLFAAMGARSEFGRGAAMGHALRIGQGARIRTVFSRPIGAISFCGRWVGAKAVSAGLTDKSNRHQKILPTKDVRLVSQWGRPAVGSRLFGTVHEAVPSPCGIVPQRG